SQQAALGARQQRLVAQVVAADHLGQDLAHLVPGPGTGRQAGLVLLAGLLQPAAEGRLRDADDRRAASGDAATGLRRLQDEVVA
ncbi:hypothetical protein DF186_20545, partial [Enterococcus hirae]